MGESIKTDVFPTPEAKIVIANDERRRQLPDEHLTVANCLKVIIISTIIIHRSIYPLLPQPPSSRHCLVSPSVSWPHCVKTVLSRVFIPWTTKARYFVSCFFFVFFPSFLISVSKITRTLKVLPQTRTIISEALLLVAADWLPLAL